MTRILTVAALLGFTYATEPTAVNEKKCNVMTSWYGDDASKVEKASGVSEFYVMIR